MFLLYEKKVDGGGSEFETKKIVKIAEISNRKISP